MEEGGDIVWGLRGKERSTAGVEGAAEGSSEGMNGKKIVVGLFRGGGAFLKKKSNSGTVKVKHKNYNKQTLNHKSKKSREYNATHKARLDKG